MGYVVAFGIALAAGVLFVRRRDLAFPFQAGGTYSIRFRNGSRPDAFGALAGTFGASQVQDMGAGIYSVHVLESKSVVPTNFGPDAEVIG